MPKPTKSIGGINMFLRMQLTTVVKDAIMKGIDKYLSKQKDIKMEYHERQLLAEFIIASLGNNLQDMFDMVKASIAK